MAAWSKAWVYGRSPAAIVSFETHQGHGCLSVVSVVCCQVEVSATDWSLVQRSPTDCGASLCVIKKPRTRGGYSPARGLQNTNPQWVVAPGEKEIRVVGLKTVLKRGSGITGLRKTAVCAIWWIAVHKTEPFLEHWVFLEYFRNPTLFVEPYRSLLSSFSTFQGFQPSIYINFYISPTHAVHPNSRIFYWFDYPKNINYRQNIMPIVL